jgi:cbb3-type cytochrome oxidase subunit 3
MNFKEVFNLTNAGLLSEIALIIFLGVFAAVAIRVFTRSRSEMNNASNLPLEEGLEQEIQQ